MNNDWVLIHTTTDLFEARLIEKILVDNGIPCFPINKKDSAYVVIGDIELYTTEEYVKVAKELIKDNLNVD